MFIKINSVETSIRYVPLEEIGIKDSIEGKTITGYPWTYLVLNKQLFFLSAIKYGIEFEEVK
jgi:hypothetical protein